MQRVQTLLAILFIATCAILHIYRMYFTEVRESTAPSIHKETHFKVIVAFGDSLTEGLFDWPNSRQFHPYTIKLQRLINKEVKRANSELNIVVRNFGISGERLQESMKQRLRGVILATNPDFVIILGGTNDLLDMAKGASDYDVHRRSNELIRDTQRLHIYCHHKGIPTAVLSIPETAIDDRDQNATVSLMRRMINDEMRDFTNSSKHTTYVDISTKIGRKRNEKYWDDGVHFTPMGYDRVGEIIFQEIRPVIKSWIDEME